MTVQSLDAYRTHRRSLKGARILVVDDEATVRMIIQQFLENAGFTVTVATSGEEALHCLDNDKFDLMLLDIVMPDMGGLAVLKTVRQKYSKSQFLIIMVTVKEESADILESFSLGANDYIVKPVDFTVLRARIDMHLSHQRAENELREARDVLEHRVEERTAELLATNKALVSEIAERKQIEEKLKRSHALYGQAEQMGKLGHWEWDHINDRMVTCSKEFARIYGMTVNEAVEFFSSWEDDLSTAHPDDRERYEQCILDSEEQQKEVDIEYRIINPSGAIRHVHLRSENVLDDEGRIITSFGAEQDITEQKKGEEAIRHLAYHDELTGLPTLRLAKDRLSGAIALARRNKFSIAVLFLDLDGFKEINDSMGHKAGDHVLNEVAKRLKHCVRETDTVARIGGDEFIIVLTELVEESAVVKMAEKLIKTLTRPMGINGQDVNISASIGIALYPDHSEIPDELICQADEAMYLVKHNGKNGYLIA